MTAFLYEAREKGGAAVKGSLEADSRRDALRLLSDRGLFPLRLEETVAAGKTGAAGNGKARSQAAAPAAGQAVGTLREAAPRREGGRIRRREITAFTREMATLLEASIPIPPALASLAEEESSTALKAVIEDLASSVRRGVSFSQALRAHPRHFSPLYSSMVEVGEEAGALPRVMADLADLLEGEDEMRAEVLQAVAYPVFVLVFGALTAVILLTAVLPRLFGMLEEMVDVLPLPTRVLLATSRFLETGWPWVLLGAAAGLLGLRAYLRTPGGALAWDALKLRLPVLGPVFRSAALSRFARTLGTLAKSGVSLLPALAIVRNTIGNRVYSGLLNRVAEETRGGDSLATPLRRLGIFPATVVQMIAVGEETGRLDTMLLKVAHMEEREMRGRSRALISLLAPILILVVGVAVGFIVIGILLPIFRMSQTLR